MRMGYTYASSVATQACIAYSKMPQISNNPGVQSVNIPIGQTYSSVLISSRGCPGR
ncbi:hypothetical protein M434DRAFT_392988 [Hypoxylon sp. CO27-5]|nr:hypothetical protein M434DRAFT_392988 [Hypoxylon sp. CO27-5]